jgi:hypothetical protein
MRLGNVIDRKFEFDFAELSTQNSTSTKLNVSS